MTTQTDPNTEHHSFQAEVSRLLHLMVHSVYSETEVFLRELLSNAADACDKLRYLALTDESLLGEDGELKVTVTLDKAAGRLTVTDNGIGMNKADLVENLGTIARSGTAQFIEAATEIAEGQAAPDLIGQFGVGFYSAFMVADKVEVITQKAGEDAAWHWTSDGLGGFDIVPGQRHGRGTTIVLHIKDGQEEYLDGVRVNHIVRTYSDHLPLPILVADLAEAEEANRLPKQVNTAAALWTRPKADITDEQYQEFYRHVGHMYDAPWHTIHTAAEGVVSYTLLLFVPTERPFDIYQQERKNRLKLYVRRVFITDEAEDLVPPYLRFLRGVVDCEDLPLNISREMLQNNPVLLKLRANVINKVLSELKTKAKNDPDGYAKFWDIFGAILKEGLFDDDQRRDKLLDLTRFKTTQSGEGWASVAEIETRLTEGQKAVYYAVGEDAASVLASPQLEGFHAKGIEVLLLTDPVDTFWLPHVTELAGLPLKSITQAVDEFDDAPDDKEDGEDAAEKPETAAVDALIAALKTGLGAAVADVVVSKRLTDSPCCLVADAASHDLHVEKVLKRYGGMAMPSQRVLEINATHPMVAGLAARAVADAADPALIEAGHLLLDQARILEGEAPADPAAFARRISAAMAKAFAAS